MSFASRVSRSTRPVNSAPQSSYLTLAYGLYRGGILIVLEASGFDQKELRSLDTALVFVAMLLGPCVGGLVTLGCLEGAAGLRELASSLAFAGEWARLGTQWRC